MAHELIFDDIKHFTIDYIYEELNPLLTKKGWEGSAGPGNSSGCGCHWFISFSGLVCLN
jgi:hypothetical protein